MIGSSVYVNDERRIYSLYVLQQRAIPHAADGLKTAARRVLWVNRDGKKRKSAEAAAAAVPIHPHADPVGAVNTLAAPYTNNIALLEGSGAFGTLLKPTAYSAPRYTSVKVSKFTQDVVFRDIEIVPMQPNYDDTLEEPSHFLPLVPVALLNPQNGIAVGFASNILPRALPDIIKAQIAALQGKSFFEETPELTPINQKSVGWVDTPQGFRAVFHGEFERKSATELKITNLPYGIIHKKYREKLVKLKDEGTIIDFTDRSSNKYDINVKFKRGVLSKLDDEGILELLGLVNNISENLTVINFDGETVWSTTYEEFITEFCEWRLTWYKARYQRLADLLAVDIQRYKDHLLAIRKNVGGLVGKIKSRSELKEYLKKIGVVHVDYIADLSIYRFTQEEKAKVEERLREAEAIMVEYKALLRSESKRREVYIAELKDVNSKFKRGCYA